VFEKLRVALDAVSTAWTPRVVIPSSRAGTWSAPCPENVAASDRHVGANHGSVYRHRIWFAAGGCPDDTHVGASQVGVTARRSTWTPVAIGTGCGRLELSLAVLAINLAVHVKV
jgi:hypothetical protein